MLSPSQQQARLRKFLYIGGILLLFTASLLLRTLKIEPEATRLQLREQTRGEVALTDSGIRLMLTGSRGLVNTYLWLSAIEKQKKHEWNELDLLVRSLTKLQPHFLSPWLFQSWNLSFNVAVECDQPRDKYFYIARGIELLAEGERRNQGSDNPDPELRFPGSPELRHNIGFFYQLKVGQSDDQNVMRCFFDMGCIDPSERDPEALTGAGKAGRTVNLQKFRVFCEKHPRLVRRLSEKLGYDDPETIVAFLGDNKEIPSRFKKPAPVAPGSPPEPTPLKEAEEQFPVLPRDSAEVDPRQREFRKELSVFTACRYWYTYAQKDLPPPTDRPGIDDLEVDLRKYRRPKMSIYIFRGYPARGQAYIGENLEKEGFFDKDGWQMKKSWFDGEEVRVGTETKYWAQPAWERAYEMTRRYGLENGMYHTDKRLTELIQKADRFRLRMRWPMGQQPPARIPNLTTDVSDEFDAYRIVYWGKMQAHTANFDARLSEAEAEKEPDAVKAHKLFFLADRLRRFEDSPELALEKYEEAWPIWLDVLLTHPKFRRDNSSMQEDTYEIELKYSRLLQKEHEAKVFHPVLVGVAQTALWPPLPLMPTTELKAPHDWGVSAREVLQSLGLANVPEVKEWLDGQILPYEVRRSFTKETLDGMNLIRISRGPFQILFYEKKVDKHLEPEAFRNVVLAWSRLDVGPFAPLSAAVLTGFPAHLSTVQKERILITHPNKGPWSPGVDEQAPWLPLIPEDAIRSVRERFGLGALRPAVPPSPPPGPPGLVTPRVGP
jgi:hypothetical protein